MARQPRALRYHPSLFHKPSGRSFPAMVAAIGDRDGRFIACHRTWLEVCPDGVGKAPVEDPKRTLGSYRGGYIRLWRGASGVPFGQAPDETVDVSEGIEDGLSVAYACPECQVIAAISLVNIATLLLPAGVTTLRIWAQNDTNNQALAGFDRAVRAHLAAGRQVLVPTIARGKDVNDLLRG